VLYNHIRESLLTRITSLLFYEKCHGIFFYDHRESGPQFYVSSEGSEVATYMFQMISHMRLMDDMGMFGFPAQQIVIITDSKNAGLF